MTELTWLEATQLPPAVVPRGDGQPPYRARKTPSAIVARLNGYAPGVLVLRTHDTTVGDVLAAPVLAGLLITGQLDEHAPTGEPVWVRYVTPWLDVAPWEDVYELEARGTAGATPAILYADPTPDHAAMLRDRKARA